MKQETINTLIDYYKWIVNISIFVITVSISLISAVGVLRFSNMLKWGFLLLSVSIFINWLVVKKLVAYSIIGLENIETELSRFFVKTLPTLKTYGLFQNSLFFLGLILIALSFLIEKNNI